MKLLYDIRAEVWIADRKQNIVMPDDIVVRPQGTFSRAYSSDILKVETYESDTHHPPTHVLHVSREGLYDSLPEVIHHPPSPPLRAGRDEARAMLEQSKRLRREETEARTFWLPFEQELFRQRVRIEEQEALALTRAYGAIWDELHGYLWGDLGIPLSPRQRACLLSIWTNAYRIVGDWEQTAFYLEEFLQTPVQIRYGAFNDITTTVSANASPAPLGAGRLGQDWVLSVDTLIDDGGTVRIAVGPLSNDQLNDYLPGGIGLTYIGMLADYLLPADADWQLEVQPDENDNIFCLSNDDTSGRLGLTTTLN
ncbi:type VI secretion system baseplate subunit TssG [Spirosoma terrae]|uniref:Type VI secretion system baseplate subunit TssG n=1 Tax=Spirosoma terrae TaxID=1968276 RepID=A0A6L9LC99_9BACT|nr:type VI secretion system baseplate subunit TssG [Spirosoma terrae]NDU96741.1 type VI secretion system baseplate subunit TssG [Spirosoma terrae]